MYCMAEYYDTSKIIDMLKARDDWCDTFIDKSNMAVGVLRLKPNQDDPQMPHAYDEIYYIIQGDGYLKLNGKDIKLKQGMVIFVPAYAEHKFHSNSKELIALYVFAGEDKDINE